MNDVRNNTELRSALVARGAPVMPDVTLLMAFEQGELDEDEVIDLFQELVNTGYAWRLQGFYGRIAMNLIQAGLVIPPPPPPGTPLADDASYGDAGC